jgi:hypothetical protein
VLCVVCCVLCVVCCVLCVVCFVLCVVCCVFVAVVVHVTSRVLLGVHVGVVLWGVCAWVGGLWSVRRRALLCVPCTCLLALEIRSRTMACVGYVLERASLV